MLSALFSFKLLKSSSTEGRSKVGREHAVEMGQTEHSEGTEVPGEGSMRFSEKQNTTHTLH